MRSRNSRATASWPEAEVAQPGGRTGAEAAARRTGPRTSHRPCRFLSRSTKAGPSWNARCMCAGRGRTLLERSIHRFPLTFYVGGIALLTLAGHRSALCSTRAVWRCMAGRLVFFTLVFLLVREPTGRGVDELAVHAAGETPPAARAWIFPRGIAPDCRTMVVVPDHAHAARKAWIASSKSWRSTTSRTAIQHLHFALLTDFRDAPEEILPEDERCCERVRDRHRDAQPAVSNPNAPTSSSCSTGPAAGTPGRSMWMGYERKRGKLDGVQRAACAADRATAFPRSSGETLDPAGDSSYVITLDTDTQLPRDAARQLVGTMAHPLNRPRVRSACAGSSPKATASCSRASA